MRQIYSKRGFTPLESGAQKNNFGNKIMGNKRIHSLRFFPFRKRSLTGFTVIELMVVISIIAILLTFIIPMGGKAKLKARIAKTKAEIGALETAISAYYADMGHYPTDDTSAPNEVDNTDIITYLSGRTGGTGAYDTDIVNDANWNGPYMEFDADNISGGQFIDPWGNAYSIEIDLDGDITTTPPSNNALSYDITSNGPSGGDAVTNY